MDPTQDPFGTSGNDGLSLSSSADSPSFDLSGFNSQSGGGTSNFADPNGIGGNFDNSPSYFSGAGSYYYPSTGQPSPFNGWSGTSSPSSGAGGLASIFGQLGSALLGSPATSAGPATPGALGNLGLSQNGSLTTTGMLAIGGAVLLAFLLLRK